MESDDLLEMIVSGLILDARTGSPIVILKEASVLKESVLKKGENDTFASKNSIQQTAILPIWIGMAEATSIASVLKKLNLGRPLTHDLMHNMLFQIGASLKKILINDLKSGTFYAELVVAIGERLEIFDARPSDALALAIRCGCPIFVSKEVLKEAQAVFNINDQISEAMSKSLNHPNQTGNENIKETGHESNVKKINEISSSDQNLIDKQVVQETEESSISDFTSIERDQWDKLLKDMNPDDFKYKI
jgi:uncharacterized protein